MKDDHERHSVGNKCISTEQAADSSTQDERPETVTPKEHHCVAVCR